MALKARKIKTKTYLKATLKSNGNTDFIRALSDGQTMTVRFLSEPEKFVEYKEHYNAEYKYFPCDTDSCPGCADGHKAAKRFLVAVLVIDETGKPEVAPVKITPDLLSSISMVYEKFGTITDRNYDLSRTGSGMSDTKYQLFPEGPTRIRGIERYTPPGGEEEWGDWLWGILEKKLPNNVDSDDEDDEPPVTKKVNGKTTRSRRVVEEDDDDDFDDEEEEEEDEPPRRSVPKRSAVVKKSPSTSKTNSSKSTIRRSR